MTAMEDLWIPICIGLPMTLIMVAFAWFHQRAERARPNPPTLGPSGRASIHGVPSLDALENEPQVYDALRGRVRSVYTMSLPVFTAGGEGGNGVHRNSGLFIIDTEGALHEPSGFRQPLELEALGHQLADALGVPFDLR